MRCNVSHRVSSNRRRSTLIGLVIAVWATGGGLGASPAHAASRSNVVRLRGNINQQAQPQRPLASSYQTRAAELLRSRATSHWQRWTRFGVAATIGISIAAGAFVLAPSTISAMLTGVVNTCLTVVGVAALWVAGNTAWDYGRERLAAAKHTRDHPDEPPAVPALTLLQALKYNLSTDVAPVVSAMSFKGRFRPVASAARWIDGTLGARLYQAPPAAAQ